MKQVHIVFFHPSPDVSHILEVFSDLEEAEKYKQTMLSIATWKEDSYDILSYTVKDKNIIRIGETNG